MPINSPRRMAWLSPRFEHVAERLGCDRGTSHQRRAASSVTFCDMSARNAEFSNAEFVVRLIDGQTRSLPAVAELLGFSAQSALARAARGLAEASRNGGSKSL